MQRPPTDGWTLGRVVAAGLIAIGVTALVIVNPPAMLLATSSGARAASAVPKLSAAAHVFGESGDVHLQVRMPGELFDVPVEFGASDEPPSYLWLTTEDSIAVVEPRAMTGTTVQAPVVPGLYRLALMTASGRHIVDSLIVGVLVPFSSKLGSTLNGYRIGRYRWERLGGEASPPPAGFLPVLPQDVDLAISDHLMLGSFLTHDAQEVWPRYVALDPRILDKIELVLADLDVKDFEMPMDVSSGFRTPLYNRTVPRAAGDSRHQYGDAADLAIDVDGDGRVTFADAVAVARAVDRVERRHPDLVGGLGLYGNRGTSPYVHMDVRGTRSRWRG